MIVFVKIFNLISAVINMVPFSYYKNRICSVYLVFICLQTQCVLLQTEVLLPLRLPDILCTSSLALNSFDNVTLKIGFLGLGTMGSSIVSALLEAGHIVHVWNRTPSKVCLPISSVI